MVLRLDTAWALDGTDAVQEAMGALETSLEATPDLVFFHGAQDCDPGPLAAALHARWPLAQIHGGSTCLGVMTQGTFDPGPRSFGLLGISDPDGAYGVGIARLGADPREGAKRALREALGRAQRPGEMPAMVMLSAPPGCEEELLRGITGMIGAHVPVVGGSAADDEVSGRWWVCGNETVDAESVVITVLFPSGGVLSAIQSGYEATGSIGVITRAGHRIIHEIDGRPAAQVYNAWTEGAIADLLPRGGKVAQGISAIHPIGRQVGASGEVVEFMLSFLNKVLPDGSIAVFTEVQEGDRVWMMRGDEDSLVTRAGRMVRVRLDALSRERGSEEVAGAIVFFCASSLAYIRERMPEVIAGLDAALGDKPYLGAFTFGEQGCFLTGGNRHGNLMVSTVLFTRRAQG